MFHFEIHEPSFLPHLGCQLTLDLVAGEGLVLKGENGLGKSSLLRYLWQQHADSQLSWVTQEPLDFFYNRPLHTFKKIFLETSGLLIDQTLFEKYWVLFGFEAKLNRTLWQLSGGEGQLLKLLCGLSKKAELFLLDEPFQFLDSEKKKMLNDLIRALRSERKSFLVVEHEPANLLGQWRVLDLAEENQMIKVRSEWTI